MLESWPPASGDDLNQIDKAFKAIENMANNISKYFSPDSGSQIPSTVGKRRHAEALAPVEHGTEHEVNGEDGEPGSIQEAFKQANNNIKEYAQRN